MNNLAFGAKPAVLRCGRCGKFVDWEDSRLQVVCGCRPRLELPPVLVREATPVDREKALELFKRDFGHRIRIARREAKETYYWLQLLAHALPELNGQTTLLLQEAQELKLILSSIAQKTS